MTELATVLKTLVSRIDYFTDYFGHVALRPYQIEAADAVIQSILNKDGDTFVWKFARQSGKDETLTALYQYLLTILAHRDASIIAAAPTFKPQTGQSMQRLDTRLSRNLVLQKEWRRRMRHIYSIRDARVLFYSASPRSSVVGATAWPLLVINEAQDVLPAVYDKRFAPMAAATNATRLFSGTAWTRDTLLAREERWCRQQQEQDGRNRVFVVDGPAVARVHPPYAKFLESEIRRLGANHPIVLSQYLCQEIDSQAGMFSAARRLLMRGDIPPTAFPSPNSSSAFGDGPRTGPNAFLLDVAGQDENRLHDIEKALHNPGRDSVTLRVVDIDLSTLETLQAPTYRVVHTRQWTGANHLHVFGQIKALCDHWRPEKIVIDATGVGEGLWAMLDKAFPTRASFPSSSMRPPSPRSGTDSSPSSKRAAFATAIPPPRPTGSTPPASPRCSSAPAAPCAGASPKTPAMRTANSSTTTSSWPTRSSSNSTSSNGPCAPRPSSSPRVIHSMKCPASALRSRMISGDFPQSDLLPPTALAGRTLSICG